MKGETNNKLAWNALRSTLQNGFSFYDIKDIVGLAGFDLASIASLVQKTNGGASKGQLMTGIDQVLNILDEDIQQRFVAVIAEEVLHRRPDLWQSLDFKLSRLGWSLCGDNVIPIGILDTSILGELPSESQTDLTKAAQRLRDGDLSGSISSVCGALDSATSVVYQSANLGDPTQVSFQERCICSLKSKGFFSHMEQQLLDLDWSEKDVNLFCKNVEKAMNHGAYVMQSLRSKMGDVHGTKPILKPLVFVCLKWAELILRALKVE